MKKILGLLLLIVFIGCTSEKEKKIRDGYKLPATVPVEYENCSIPLYEANAKLRPIFDSLTQIMKNCPYETNRDNVLYVSLSEQNDTLKVVSIDLMFKKGLYCENIHGIVVYNQESIILNQKIINDTLFLKTGLNVNFKCRKEDIFMYDPIDWRDGWSFFLENGKIRFLSYSICGQGWYDEKFYPDVE